MIPHNIQPITPHGLAIIKAAELPDWVIKTWNQLIVSRYNNGFAYIPLVDALEALEEASPDQRKTIPANFLRVDSIYEVAGWEVKRDTDPEKLNSTILIFKAPCPSQQKS